jgi:hypothetical protein
MAADDDPAALRRRAEFMQALTTEHTALQSARSSTVSESAARSGLYLTTLSSAVVALALVGQVSKFGDAFLIFALAILPVVFLLGLITYGRLLQTGVEDVIYARAIGRIHRVYERIDPNQAQNFSQTQVDQVGLEAVGLFRLRWQQFLASAAAVAVVNAVVGGAFIAIVAGAVWKAPLAAISLGAVASVLLAAGVLRHQWRTWMRVAKALPPGGDGPASG